MQHPPEAKAKPKRKLFATRRAYVIYAIFLIAAVTWWFWPQAVDSRFTATYTAKKGDLEITIVEGGSLEAQEKVEVKSEVEGQTKILSIVDEGYFVTPDDVESMKVLVELDSTEIREKQTQQELQYQNAYAAYAQAREQYSIQVNQNDSDMMAGELEVKFARMDFERYVGEDVAKKIIAEADAARAKDDERKAAALPPNAIKEEGNSADAPPKAVSSEAQTAGAPPETAQAGDEPLLKDKDGMTPAEVDTAQRMPKIDFAKYADIGQLGQGEAGQRLRTLENTLTLSEKQMGLTQSKLSGTQRLYDKQFVTKSDLEQDEMALKRGTTDVDSAKVAKDLFLKYEFNKSAQKMLSDYLQSQSKLQRTRQSAVAKIAQVEATLRSAEANYDLQATQRRKIKKQIEKCTIRATKPGLVVYGSGNNERYYGNEQIEEGATVRERQVIITIPDTTRMAVNANIHEGYVKLVNKGQKVRVRADANRDRLLTGEVTKIAVLPNSENRWMNPDVKVYETNINIEGNNDWLKPGMSAQVEIVAGVLSDVIYIPLDAVFNEDSKRVVYISTLTGPQRREVETGEFNDSSIEVKKGLAEGEVVLLRAPEKNGEGDDGKDSKDGKKDKGDAPKGEKKGGKKESARVLGASGAERA